MKIFAENRRARFDYELLEKIEAGISLLGHEVKAIKSGKIHLAGSFVVPKDNELWLINADIPPYQPKNTSTDYDPKRSRKLLITSKQISTLLGKTHSTSLTIIPIRVYNKHGLIKVEIALAKPKKKHNKREVLRKRDITRDTERTLKSNG